MKTLKVLKYAGFGVLGLAFVILVVFGVQALWNWLIPVLFNGPVLSFWQTAGLLILAKILLAGIAPGRSHYYYRKDWRSRYREKYWDRCREEYMKNRDIPDAEKV
jgi:membrane-bound ClpP family serine protease